MLLINNNQGVFRFEIIAKLHQINFPIPSIKKILDFKQNFFKLRAYFFGGFMNQWLFCLIVGWSVLQAETRVYVDIVGDLFHAGHIEFLKKAKAFGDYLIVGVLADENVEEYKRRPVLTLAERVKVIEACALVDEVIVAPPLRLTEEMIRNLKIDYVVHGDDFNRDLLEDQYGAALRAGIFRTVPYTAGISTTGIIRRVVDRHNQGEFE